jgi:hypothetical protein
MKRAAVVIAMLAVTFMSIIAQQASSSPVEIENRILRATTYALSRFEDGAKFSGFLHSSFGTGANRSYTEDNSLMALALSSYQETHFSTRFYENLQDAIRSIEAAQTAQGDFSEYFDFASSSWGSSGKMSCWDAYAVMGAAYAAYVVMFQSNSDASFWRLAINQLRLFADKWMPKSQGQDGAVIFSSSNSSDLQDVGCNGVLLMGLMYIAAFEFSWGDKTAAAKYATYSQRIANWLYTLQESNATSWGLGGFYSNSSKTVQPSYENALVMFGLNAYYKVIGLFLPNIRASLEPLRQTQKLWADGYVEKILDRWGGVSFSRNEAGVTAYPKTTRDASATLAAMVDVWINLGPPTYWNDSARIYAWMIGSNENSIDLQSQSGDFQYALQNHTTTSSDLGTTSLAVYSLIRAQYISIPGEYPVQVAKTTKSSNIVSRFSTSETATVTGSNEKPNTYQIVAAVAIVTVVLIGSFVAKKPRKKGRTKGRA